MRLKIRTARNEFVEFETEDERRAAILDLLEKRTNVEPRYIKPAQELNLEGFNAYLDELVRKANLPSEQEKEAVIEEKSAPKRKAKDQPQA